MIYALGLQKLFQKVLQSKEERLDGWMLDRKEEGNNEKTVELYNLKGRRGEGFGEILNL